MRLLLLAPPGAGKGTQGERLAAWSGVRHIAAGDLLRAQARAGGPLGREIAACQARGDLVPDQIVLDVLTPAVVEAAARGGYILDGFPRTLPQATAAAELALRLGVRLDAAVYLYAPEEVLTRRLLGRAGQGGRADDVADVIQHRLRVFAGTTGALVPYYTERGILVAVDADQPPDSVTAGIQAGLRERLHLSRSGGVEQVPDEEPGHGGAEADRDHLQPVLPPVSDEGHRRVDADPEQHSGAEDEGRDQRRGAVRDDAAARCPRRPWRGPGASASSGSACSGSPGTLLTWVLMVCLGRQAADLEQFESERLDVGQHAVQRGLIRDGTSQQRVPVLCLRPQAGERAPRRGPEVAADEDLVARWLRLPAAGHRRAAVRENRHSAARSTEKASTAGKIPVNPDSTPTPTTGMIRPV